ncbi:MAG TPA: hypothetical protein VN939_13835, partial [Chthoniobacterales bacterium]|nr:hypothetical protein [Chthoniobacterales bacterium]
LAKAAREVGITANGLRKWCIRCKGPLPSQGYWNLPPESSTGSGGLMPLPSTYSTLKKDARRPSEVRRAPAI